MLLSIMKLPAAKKQLVAWAKEEVVMLRKWLMIALDPRAQSDAWCDDVSEHCVVLLSFTRNVITDLY